MKVLEYNGKFVKILNFPTYLQVLDHLHGSGISHG